MKLIKPHGGKLVNREVRGPERDRLIQAAVDMPALQLNARDISELEMIAIGAYSPLQGFLDRSDYNSVCVRMRLTNGVAWPIPVTLPIPECALSIIKAIGCWEERLVSSIGRAILPFQHIVEIPQRRGCSSRNV